MFIYCISKPCAGRKALLFAFGSSSSLLDLSLLALLSSLRKVSYFTRFLYRNINMRLKYLHALLEQDAKYRTVTKSRV